MTPKRHDMERYSVTVTKDLLEFSSAHFITYGGGHCERLHGHNYRVRVTLRGELDEDALVYDFSELKKLTVARIEPLDHRMLLPDGNDELDVTAGETGVTVRFREREYRFPAEDTVILPIANTTAEMLASHLAEGLLEDLRRAGGDNLRTLEVEVEESPGQSGLCVRPVD